ncbi:MAG: fatty-acid--CoA ligase [Acidimicrobiales bacterium]|nr:fatty-acid--CoA ligase [Acidimicrobiales bacterium]
MSSGWNFADVWETIADEIPDARALVDADHRRTWAELDHRADGVALALLNEAGAAHQDKVAQYLYNGNEYTESVVACTKAGLVPVNTNYRYTDDELTYIWDNSDAVAVVFHGAFAERVASVRARVPNVRLWLWVDDGSGPCPDWAVPYEDAATSASPGRRTRGPAPRSGADLYFLYTGGTTGMPKGVMWRQDDLYDVFSAATMHDPPTVDLDAVRRRVNGAGPVGLPACPLMHGTGAFTSFQVMFLGGSIVTLTSRKFDAAELLDTIERERVNALAWVGDAFARPVLAALDAAPGHWDISSLVMITSSGVMWSEPVKEGLLRHHPGMMLVDAFSSSEALGMGMSVSGGGRTTKTASFALGDRSRVIDDDGRDVEPGSGRIGRVAVQGPCPVGYYKDPEKTARTFLTIDGERFSVPGDYATVDADGTLQILGRGSVCINTGGEKVFPEEVEEALKGHPAVLDAVVVGVPDERFGEVVVAWVEPIEPAGDIDEADVIAHVKGRLAAYKAPRRVLATDSIGRSPAGKVDYTRLRGDAVAAMGG